MITMRLPNSVIEAHPWRIREITPDFTLEDVWALPAYGDADDFQRLLDQTLSSAPTDTGVSPTRVLWVVRDLLGKVFGLGRISGHGDDDAAGPLPIPGTTETSLTGRLPGRSARHARPACSSARCRSSPSTAPTTSSRRRSQTRPCTP